MRGDTLRVRLGDQASARHGLGTHRNVGVGLLAGSDVPLSVPVPMSLMVPAERWRHVYVNVLVFRDLPPRVRLTLRRHYFGPTPDPAIMPTGYVLPCSGVEVHNLPVPPRSDVSGVTVFMETGACEGPATPMTLSRMCQGHMPRSRLLPEKRGLAYRQGSRMVAYST